MTFKKRIVPVALAFSILSGVVAVDIPTRAEAAATEQQEQVAKMTMIKPLNTMTLQITFNQPLAAEDVDQNNLAAIKKHFTFNGDLEIVNVPRLMTGAKSTYIVPVTFQEDDFIYTVSYKEQRNKVFEGTDEKVFVRDAAQVTNDTLKLESFLEDGVVDYANIIEAYRQGRGSLAFSLDKQNRDANGQRFDVISSLRDRYVTVKGSNGEEFVANYVPFTQAADGKQAPQFRLPAGETFKTGVTYRVYAEWAEIDNKSFVAKVIAPLTIQSAKTVDEKSIEIQLAQDPQADLLAGRSVELQGTDGSKLQAQYRYSSRKGTIGIFDITGGTLQANVSYKVLPLNNWAAATNITLTAKSN
ncbi:hypothetical protein [Lysinibacillus piscis]|uniref:S-layer protein n=1 Tax=Lysinibacillus piscis TaxID=2518931 RepID=A0ABQ5NKB9_9BACI|nr:hypothetical protein [Lysinibacillus sp. KH24]GLC88810.1 hypothetical protein LYSBPC_19370 [Lysinibacillus sp. KH24]